MEIKTISLIGLGALGAMFGQQLQTKLEPGQLRVIADSARIARYQETGIYVNGERCDFDYVTPDESGQLADLVIFAVKYAGLAAAIEAAGNQVGPQTMVLSLLNGIVSEEMLGAAFGAEKVIYCVAQGMDARRTHNQIDYENMGWLSIGEKNQPATSRVKAITALFDQVGIRWETPANMEHKLWSKFMMNCGVNQSAMVYATNYGGLQADGAAREAVLAAMQEVLALAAAEDIPLPATELAYWLNVLDQLSPASCPSMKQDADAQRYSEVELFSGTVCRLGKKHSIATPVNDYFYEQIQKIEADY